MTNKTTFTTDPFKKYVTCIRAFFIPLTSVKHSQFYPITSLVLFTKNNKLWNEHKEDVYVAASVYHVILKESLSGIF